MAPDDGLFLERFESFLAKSLTEIDAFARREGRSFDEIRERVAEWHCKFIFKTSPGSTNKDSNKARTESVLKLTSETLESLHEVSGKHSFFLVVDPLDSSDEGFLGGTVEGREFWRGIRGGGTSGVQLFKSHCLKTLQRRDDANNVSKEFRTPEPSTAGPKRSPAMLVKAEVYSAVRTALRLASGDRTAEMKWTNHDSLQYRYGVRLVGWPLGVPMQNPSALSTAHNKLIVESLESGKLQFVRIAGPFVEPASPQVGLPSSSALPSSMSPVSEDLTDLSWAYDDSSAPESSSNKAVSEPHLSTHPSSSLNTFALEVTAPVQLEYDDYDGFTSHIEDAQFHPGATPPLMACTGADVDGRLSKRRPTEDCETAKKHKRNG